MPKITVHMADDAPRTYVDATAVQDDELGLTVTKSGGSRAVFPRDVWRWFEEEPDDEQEPCPDNAATRSGSVGAPSLYDAGARNERELASSPIVACQGNMFGTGDRNVIFVRVMADDYKRLRELVCGDGDGNRTLPPHEVIRAAVDRLPRIPTASS